MKSRAKEYQWHIEWREPSELIPYEYNAKLHDDKQVKNIANSIKRFGWQQPAVVTNDDVLIIGHGRRLAALKLKCKMPVKVIEDDLTEDDIKELRLADNLTNESGWDYDLRAFDAENLSFEGFDFDLDVLSGGGLDESYKPEKTDVQYFDEKEIEQAIVDNWRTYEDAKAFAAQAIDEAAAMFQFNRLCQGYNDGYNISLLFNAHRLDTETKKNKSILYGFNNDANYRKQFARYAVEVAERVPPQNEYYKLIGIGTAGYQYVNEFQPYMARDIYKKYVREGDKVLNPCAGWGGRLLGIASCMFSDIEYVETDPSTETYQGLVKLKRFLRLGDQYKQYNLPFEELEVKENYFDFVFTSPPYFDTERYADEDTQSFKRYNSFETWRDAFLKPMIDKILFCMKDDGKCLLNVGNAIYKIDEAIESYLDSKHIAHRRVGDFKIGGDGIGARTGEDGEPFILFGKH